MPDVQHTQGELKTIIERGTVVYTLSNVVTKVIAISNTLLVLSSLSPYAYGVAELALSVVGVLSMFQLSGLERTVIADMGVEKGGGNMSAARRLFEDFLVLLSTFCTVAWAILFFGSGLVAQFFTQEIGSYFIIISFIFLTVPLTIAMRILYSTYFDFTASAVLTFLQEATKFVFLALFFFTDSITIAVLLWSYVIAQFAPFVLLLPRTLSMSRQLFASPASGSFAPWRFFLGHSLWTLFSNYLDTFTKSVRLWLIKLLLGTEAVALFAVAQGIVGQLSSFLSITSVVTPILPQYLSNRPIFYRIIDATLKYQLLLAVGIIGFGSISIPPFVAYLFPQYLTALSLFYVMIFVLIPSNINALFQTMFYVVKAQKSLFFAQGIRLFLTVTLGPLLMIALGPLGVAFEYVATTILFSFERYRVLQNLYGDFTIRVNNFFRYDEYDRLLLQRIGIRLRFVTNWFTT